MRKPLTYLGTSLYDDISQGDDEVEVTVEIRATGQHAQINSRHVIACDGANSRVREFLQVESEGEPSRRLRTNCLSRGPELILPIVQTMMTIHFNADLRPVVGERVGMLHWIMDPRGAGFIIGYDLGGNQVHISNYDVRG